MLKNLNTQEFKDQIFDYDNQTDFKIKNEKAVIVDFWAPWCGPCKMIGPILEELAEEYGDKLDIIKVNIDEEHEVAAVFQIRSIPSILFAPLEGEPDMVVGARGKAQLEKIIDEVLLNPIPQEKPIPVAK